MMQATLLLPRQLCLFEVSVVCNISRLLSSSRTHLYIWSLTLRISAPQTALVTAEHFAGVQGLFLAMPITLYLLNQVLYKGVDVKKESAATKS